MPPNQLQTELSRLAQDPDESPYWRYPMDTDAPRPELSWFHHVGTVEQQLRAYLFTKGPGSGATQHPTGAGLQEFTRHLRETDAAAAADGPPNAFRGAVLDGLRESGLTDPYVLARIKDDIGFRDITSGRHRWFENFRSGFDSRYQKAQEIECDAFVPAVVCNNRDAVPDAISDSDVWVYKRSELDREISLTEDAHLQLPHPMLVVHSESGAHYPFVPWHGVVVCTCADKVKNQFSYPLCKHEIAALLCGAQNGFTQQVELLRPARLRRLVHPDAVRKVVAWHQKQI